jgi:hypothetical protein
VTHSCRVPSTRRGGAPAADWNSLAGTENEWLRCCNMHFHLPRASHGHYRSPLAFTGYVNLAGVALLVLGLLLMA